MILCIFQVLYTLLSDSGFHEKFTGPKSMLFIGYVFSAPFGIILLLRNYS